MRFLKWGVETYIYGQNTWEVKLGTGSDVYLTRLVGNVSGAAMAGADVAAPVSRQSLVVVSFPSANDVINGSVVTTPNGNHGVSGALYAFNVKQRGDNLVFMPFDLTFGTPVLIPGGRLWLYIDTQTFDQAGNNVTVASEAVNTEAHLTVFFL